MAKVSLRTVRHIGCAVAACGSLSGCFDPLIEDPGANGQHNHTPGVEPSVGVPGQPGAVTPPGSAQPPGAGQSSDPGAPVTPTGSVVTPTPGVPTGAMPTGPTGATGGTGHMGGSGSTCSLDDTGTDSDVSTLDIESGDAGALDGSVGSALKHDSTSSPGASGSP